MQYLSLQWAAERGEPLRQRQPCAPGLDSPRGVQAEGWRSVQLERTLSQYWYVRTSQNPGSWPCRERTGRH